MTEISIHKEKWPDVPHYRQAGWILGEDEFGCWIEIRIPTPIYRREELVLEGRDGGLLLVPSDDTWLAWFPEFGPFQLYVDIATNLVWTADSVTVVDLDLDVVRLRNGEIRVLDEDEFLQHQFELNYPSSLVELARRQATAVLESVRAGSEPFGGLRAAEWQDKTTGS